MSFFSTSSCLILSISLSLSVSHSRLQSQSLTSIKCSGLPSVVIPSPWQPWQPWATEQRGGPQWDVSLFLVLCSPSPLRLLLPSSLAVLRPNAEKTISLCFFTPPPACGLVYPSLYLPLFFVSFMCRAVCLSGDNHAAGWWKVGSPASHAECLVAKHIKAVRRHICQSQMMIRVAGFSEGTELSFVAEDIPPYFVCLHLTSNPHQTKVSLSEVLAFRGV